jgi:predicted peptidase
MNMKTQFQRCVPRIERTLFTFLLRAVSKRSTVVCLLVGLLAGASGTAGAVSVDDFVPLWFTNAQGVIAYRLFIPTNYTSAERYPLVLYLHGLGAGGNDNWSQLGAQSPALVFASETNQLVHPSFMVAPQCPVNSTWADSWMLSRLFGLIQALQTNFSLDTNRLYITGLSMGGNGTWENIGQYPGMYAAAVPMSGWANTALVSKIAQTPIWNFHVKGSVPESGTSYDETNASA